MSRLVDDPSKVGPGSYENHGEVIMKSPRGVIDWSNSMSQRGGIKPSISTHFNVGPGSYNQGNRFYKPNQPSFARSGLAKSKAKSTRHRDASIRNDFEDPESDDDDRKKDSPGPGAYKTHDSSF